ncbi:TRL-like family protein [Helicobacter sp. MIT 14-3879]|uniref:TRL-like family protein n=1 Tax=Helicobacter sp. MIT 14-3879 TaxID=2040649 RepID=UPI000E1F9C5C|nr:TRL-like family protein [Helicobacter sp. MIT 14-3879]RDU62273.1 hypothetical protein CQA44_07205 [Helicobacter sp. MIT 14-3879]
MKKLAIVSILLGLFFAGCGSVQSPVSGFVYTGVKAPINSTAEKGSKTGKAVCTSILGIAAYGDCSVDAAKKDGKISKVSSIDHESFSVLGIYSTFTTIVTGE